MADHFDKVHYEWSALQFLRLPQKCSLAQSTQRLKETTFVKLLRPRLIFSKFVESKTHRDFDFSKVVETNTHRDWAKVVEIETFSLTVILKSGFERLL